MDFNQFFLQENAGVPQTDAIVGGEGDTTVNQPQSGSMLGSFVPLILIVFIFYFFMIRPQKKRQKETQNMLDALKKGDKVVTIGGIHGTVSQVKESTVVVKVDDSTKLEFNRTAIATVITDKPVIDTKSKKEASVEEKSENEAGEKNE